MQRVGQEGLTGPSAGGVLVGEKVDIKDGAYTTTALSSGQRKRLSMVTARLEELKRELELRLGDLLAIEEVLPDRDGLADGGLTQRWKPPRAPSTRTGKRLSVRLRPERPDQPSGGASGAK